MEYKAEDNSKLILNVLFGFSAAYLVFALIGAVVQGKLGLLIPGLISIMTQPAQFTRDYFEELGGLGSAFLNCSLVGFACWAICRFSGSKASGATIAAYFLNVGFCTFGMNFLNMWPFVLGVFVYSRLKKVTFGSVANLALFSTALAPFASEVIFRYPNAEAGGATVTGIILALIIGLATGICMPALCKHSPNFHKGYDLYNAGPAAGFFAFLVFCILFKARGIETPGNTNLGEGYRLFVTLFCLVVFGGCLIVGWLFNGKTLKGYGKVLNDSGHQVDFVAKYGFGPAMINLGFYGLFIWAYYFIMTWMPNIFPALTPAGMNGATMGAIFCMFAFCAAGATPKNVYPIAIGYILMSLYPTLTGGSWTITTQGILVGLCFASGLAPVSGKYGVWAGILAGAIHSLLVLNVPLWHGGFCLYNGGFTCGIVAFLLIPVLECFTKTKEEKGN